MVSYRHNLRRALGWLVAGGWLLMALPVMAAALSQGYPAQTDIPAGSIVALSTASSGEVVMATPAMAERTIGVVVAPGDSSLSLGASSGQVQVVTSGQATVFVSTANGDIKSGDPIALSTIAGVGMKATAAGRIIGIAQGSFTSQTPGAEPTTLGSGSSTRQVYVGEIPLQVGVTAYSPQLTGSGVLGVVQNFANTVSGKPVTALRLLIAGAVVLVALISATVLLYSAVRNSIIAIGRNPLAKGSVLKGLAQILALVAVVVVVAGGVAYLVIKQ